MEGFFLELSALGATGRAGDYLLLAAGLLPAMFASGEVSLGAKILGALLLLVLCMGIFVSLSELLDGLFGAVIYAVLLTLPAGALLLFDERICRTAMQDMRAFATGVVALYIPVLMAGGLLLVLATVFFLVRKLGAVPEAGNTAVPDREDGSK
jgi:hypothetical protein